MAKMTKTGDRPERIAQTAGAIGTTLGHLAKRVDSLKKQRDALAAELDHLVRAARAAFNELGLGPGSGTRRKGGRPKGKPTPEEVKATLRAAWKARREAGEKKTVHKREIPEAARAKIAVAAKGRTRVRKG